MTSTVFGWTLEQYAYAAARLGEPMPPNAEGLLAVKRWWQQHQHWPEPLTVQLAGVNPEMFMGWAAKAVSNVMAEKPGE